MLSAVVSECGARMGCGGAYGYGTDEEAPRREVEMLRRRMLLGVLAHCRCQDARRVPASGPYTSLATSSRCQAGGAMSVAAVRASELSYPVWDCRGGFAHSRLQWGSGSRHGLLDNTHDGANNARRVLREKGEATATQRLLAQVPWASRKAGSRRIEAVQADAHRHCGAPLAPLRLSPSAAGAV
jgi:hypothetical protein